MVEKVMNKHEEEVSTMAAENARLRLDNRRLKTYLGATWVLILMFYVFFGSENGSGSDML